MEELLVEDGQQQIEFMPLKFKIEEYFLLCTSTRVVTCSCPFYA
jgi:hypothetical protein